MAHRGSSNYWLKIYECYLTENSDISSKSRKQKQIKLRVQIKYIETKNTMNQWDKEQVISENKQDRQTLMQTNKKTRENIQTNTIRNRKG